MSIILKICQYQKIEHINAIGIYKMYKNLIMKSIRDIFDNYEVIGKALVIPTVLLFVLNFASTAMTSPDKHFSIASIFFIFLSFLVDIVILITVHRILILGNDSVPKWGIQKFEKREFAFFQKYLIIALVFIVVVVLTTAFFQIFGVNIFASMFLSMSVCAVYLSRISLVFPAIAVDTKMSFRDSFEFTRDFKLLIFVTVIVFPVVFSLVIGGIYTFIISMLVASLSPHLNFLMVLLNVIISVFLVSALSNTYMYISECLSHNANDENETYEEFNDEENMEPQNQLDDEIQNDESIDFDSKDDKK